MRLRVCERAINLLEICVENLASLGYSNGVCSNDLICLLVRLERNRKSGSVNEENKNC